MPQIIPFKFPDRTRQQQQPIFFPQQGTQIALGGQDQDNSAVLLGLLQLLQGQGRDQTILALEKARREDQFTLEGRRIDIEENLAGFQGELIKVKKSIVENERLDRKRANNAQRVLKQETAATSRIGLFEKRMTEEFATEVRKGEKHRSISSFITTLNNLTNKKNRGRLLDTDDIKKIERVLQTGIPAALQTTLSSASLSNVGARGFVEQVNALIDGYADLIPPKDERLFSLVSNLKSRVTNNVRDLPTQGELVRQHISRPIEDFQVQLSESISNIRRLQIDNPDLNNAAVQRFFDVLPERSGPLSFQPFSIAVQPELGPVPSSETNPFQPEIETRTKTLGEIGILGGIGKLPQGLHTASSAVRRALLGSDVAGTTTPDFVPRDIGSIGRLLSSVLTGGLDNTMGNPILQGLIPDLGNKFKVTRSGTPIVNQPVRPSGVSGAEASPGLIDSLLFGKTPVNPFDDVARDQFGNPVIDFNRR